MSSSPTPRFGSHSPDLKYTEGFTFPETLSMSTKALNASIQLALTELREAGFFQTDTAPDSKTIKTVYIAYKQLSIAAEPLHPEVHSSMSRALESGFSASGGSTESAQIFATSTIIGIELGQKEMRESIRTTFISTTLKMSEIYARLFLGNPELLNAQFAITVSPTLSKLSQIAMTAQAEIADVMFQAFMLASEESYPRGAGCGP